MFIKNVIENKIMGKLAQAIDLGNHSKQLLIISLEASEELKPHVSKTDALLIVEKGLAKFTLWNDDTSNEYVIGEHDIVVFRANQLHSVQATETFMAILVK
jgi:quercetin dioxygenase-like cupin family protein